MKQKQSLIALLTLCAGLLAAYDVKTKDLVPVNFQKTPSHAPVKMVENGKVNFAIVADLEAEKRMHGKNKTQKSIEPAIEILREAVEKCTGTSPAILDVKDAAKTKYMIVVGDNAITRKNGIDVSKLPPQGLAVKTFDGGIILAGNDSSLIPGYNMKPLEGRQSSFGTKYAAYDFVERFLGIRYYFPGEYGILWPKMKNLTLTPVFYTDSPYYDDRNGIYYLSIGFTTNSASRKFWENYLGKLTQKDFNFYDRWRMGQTDPVGGAHCPRPEMISAAYPDKLKTIFYQSPSGNFWYNPKAHIGNYFNVVDLEFADLFFESAKKFYASNGKLDEAGFGTQGCNASFLSFGMCDTFLAETETVNHPTVKKLGLMTEKDLKRSGQYDDGGHAAMANIYARFHQYLAKRMQKEMPGRKLYIMAYYNVQSAGNDPRWTLPPNTEVFLCLGDLPNKLRNPESMKRSLQIAKEWYESLGNRPVQRLWLYTGTNPFVQAVNGEFLREIPKAFGKYTGRSTLFLDHCIEGGTPGFIWFYYYSSYAAYRSMWNPDWDAAAAIDAHWGPFYGEETGKYLREFHQLLRDCYLKYAVMSESVQRNVIYPAAELQKMENLLDKAKKSVKPGSVEEKRLNLFSAPWKKAIESVRNQLSYERPVYPIHQLLRKEEVTLDGKANENFWKNVKAMPLIDPKGSGDKPKYPASLKLAWDKTGIYGLFETTYPPVAEKKNDVWGNDNYEIFFSPGMNREEEFQFVFDALGNQFLGTQRFLPIPQPFDKHWKAPGFRHVSTMDGKKWTAEFHIPFSVFTGGKTPDVYDTWFCNIVRNKAGESYEYSGTAMTTGNNHNMNMYGMIKFAGKGE